MDKIDVKLLDLLQQDATTPVSTLAEAVGLSNTPCWRRIRQLEESGVIRRRVTLLDPEAINVGTTVFVAIRTNQHSISWLERFREATADVPEITEIYRLSGEIDYMLKIVVPSIAGYDAVYKRLIQAVDFVDVSSSFAMEQMKYTTALPLSYIPIAR